MGFKVIEYIEYSSWRSLVILYIYIDITFTRIFKDIKYDIPVCQIHYIYKDIYKDIHILTERPVVLLNAISYEESRWAEAYIGCWKFQLAQIYNRTL